LTARGSPVYIYQDGDTFPIKFDFVWELLRVTVLHSQPQCTEAVIVIEPGHTKRVRARIASQHFTVNIRLGDELSKPIYIHSTKPQFIVTPFGMLDDYFGGNVTAC
jgi:hypothetical protein